MSEREYVVTVKPGVDWQELHQELTTDTSTQASIDSAVIPDRTVDVVNERPQSKRNTHYNLTAEEVTALQNDPRIEAVELPPHHRDDIELVQFGKRDGTTEFDRFRDIDYENDVQWGLFTCHSNTPLNQIFTDNSRYEKSLNYTLTGRGVDFVLHDSGITPDHPEFSDSQGNSRVQQIDWYTESGLPGTQDPLFYSDTAGHGTHVAGTVAGRYQGWAPDANIYSIKVSGLEGSGDSSGISISDCFDVVTEWHKAKPVDPVTGFKRPTVVNMSWGYLSSYVNSEYGEHQGVAWDDSSNPSTYRSEYGMVPKGQSFFSYRHPVRVASVDADVEEMIAAGIIVCSSAGNDGHKINRPEDPGYDNWYSGTYWETRVSNGLLADNKRYYHRGSSPSAVPGVITVGNIELADNGGYQAPVKRDSSTTGPRVDIWAPGSNILSSVETQTVGRNSVRYGDYDLAKFSGTSMASPQVAGYVCTFLQMRPWLTPVEVTAEVKKTSVKNEIEGVYGIADFDNTEAPTEENYTNYRAAQGSANNFLNTPYKIETVFNNTIQFQGGVILQK